MRTKTKHLSATLLGFSMLLAACSGNGEAPDALAFQDDSSGTTDPAATVPRPTGNQCASNEFSVAFDDTVVLLDNSTQASAGPFSVNVPAGTYDIIVSTWNGFTDIPDQTMEQWFFETDSGYTSPLTSDSSPALLQNQEFQNQTIGATTSVTLFHKAPGMDSVNSVHPLCIGFRSVAAPVTTTTTEAPVVTTTTEAPVVTTTTEAPVVTTTTEAPVVTTTTEAPAVAGPTTTAAPAAPTTTAAPAAPATTAAPAATAAPAVAAQAETTTTTTAAPTDPTAAPELALTGPSELALSLGLTGAALVLAGSAAVVAARKTEED